jgi:hypothetical protein
MMPVAHRLAFICRDQRAEFKQISATFSDAVLQSKACRCPLWVKSRHLAIAKVIDDWVVENVK